MSTKKNPYSVPEDFAVSPLLTLLPNEGEYLSLLELGATYYARLEKVQAALTTTKYELSSDERTLDLLELSMLEVVTNWISNNQKEI